MIPESGFCKEFVSYCLKQPQFLSYQNVNNLRSSHILFYPLNCMQAKLHISSLFVCIVRWIENLFEFKKQQKKHNRIMYKSNLS